MADRPKALVTAPFRGEGLDKLEQLGWNVTRWRNRNLYFGGAAAVTLEHGKLAAAGDPRRGGGGVVVE